jgi:quercetin dioxygenase-like cupin family protein
MKKNLGFLCGLAIGGLFVGGLSFFIHSASAAGNESKILLENDNVRVRQVAFQPGARVGPHTHPYPHVGVIIDSGSLTFVEKGKKDETKTFSAGDAGWRDAHVTHEVFNSGKTPMRIVEVELKK